MQRLVDAALPVPAAERLQARLQAIHLVVVDAVVVLELLARLLGLAHAFADRVEHGDTRLELRLLRDVGAAQAALHLQHAVVGLVDAGEDLEHARLAGAVAPDQGDALGGLEREVGAG